MLLSIYRLILLILLFGTQFTRKGFNNDETSIVQCNCIKGVFIVFVFARHIWQYFEKADVVFVFTLWIITLSMKVRIDSKILVWLGTNLFPIYTNALA